MLPFPLRLHRDYVRLERLIGPLERADPDPARIEAALQNAGADPASALARLVRHGLATAWLAALERHGAALPGALAAASHPLRQAVIAAEILKEKALAIAARALLDGGVPYVVFKGQHLSRVLYESPFERPHADVDLLVDPARVHDAVRALTAAGFRLHVNPQTVTHQVILRGHHVEVDLHWEIIRPSRTRRPLAPRLLAAAERADGLPVPGDAWTLVVMLVHPAFTEHVTGRLVRALDLARWIWTRPCPWDEVLAVLDEAHLRTPAWTMLRWTRAWFDIDVPDWVERALRPGRLHRAYLEAWLAADPAALYARHQAVVRAGFSLGLHDGVTDAARAVSKLRGERRVARAQAQRLAALDPGAPQADSRSLSEA